VNLNISNAHTLHLAILLMIIITEKLSEKRELCLNKSLNALFVAIEESVHTFKP